MKRSCHLLAWLCLLASTVHANVPRPPRAMLPTVYHGGIDVRDYWVSEKLDGVRGRWDGHHLWARSGARIDPPAWFTSHWPTAPMDGELWSGRGRFDAISGLVRLPGVGQGDWHAVRFMVFDLPADTGVFTERVMHMRRLLTTTGVPWLRAIPQFHVATTAALHARLTAVVAGGGEGLVLQRADAHYVIGRSPTLLKFKPYDDAEARVIAWTAGHGKYAGTLGALVVRRDDGLQFRLGSGLTDAQRRHPPPIGSLVTYRYNGLTAKGTPRFARFMHIRYDLPATPAR